MLTIVKWLKPAWDGVFTTIALSVLKAPK